MPSAGIELRLVKSKFADRHGQEQIAGDGTFWLAVVSSDKISDHPEDAKLSSAPGLCHLLERISCVVGQLFLSYETRVLADQFCDPKPTSNRHRPCR